MVRQRIEVTYTKKGILKFISHLDLVRLFQRAVRRADLPVVLTQGYSPHYKISFGRALKLGIESESETAIFHIDGWMGLNEFRERLQAQLPEGILIKEIKVV